LSRGWSKNAWFSIDLFINLFRSDSPLLGAKYSELRQREYPAACCGAFYYAFISGFLLGIETYAITKSFVLLKYNLVDVVDRLRQAHDFLNKDKQEKKVWAISSGVALSRPVRHGNTIAKPCSERAFPICESTST
jgi:hypothetical protein